MGLTDHARKQHRLWRLSQRLPAVRGKCEQLSQAVASLPVQTVASTQTITFHLLMDGTDGMQALLPTEKYTEESGLGLAVALNKKALRLRPGPEQREEKADRMHTVTALAWRLWAGQYVTQGEMPFLES